MSKTVRISDKLYDAIDEARTDSQTFEDFIEEMANEYGLLPEGIQTLGALERKLENVYGFERSEVEDIVTALQAIYIGDESNHTIGYPHAEAEDEYGRDNIAILKRLGLVKENHYTGKYDFGYETTGMGDKVASGVVVDFLESNRDSITEGLSKYDNRMLSFLIQFGFERTDNGRFSTRGASLSFPKNTLFDDETLQLEYDRLKEDLVELGVAVRHSEGSFVIFPPEFSDFIGVLDDDFTEVLEQVEVYKAIRDYLNDDLKTRNEILQQLEITGEPRFQETINKLHNEGFTSKYVQTEVPFLVRDRDGLVKHLQKELVDSMGYT